GLITQRSEVQILPPQLRNQRISARGKRRNRRLCSNCAGSRKQQRRLSKAAFCFVLVLTDGNDFTLGGLRGQVLGRLLHGLAEIVVGSDVVAVEDRARPMA